MSGTCISPTQRLTTAPECIGEATATAPARRRHQQEHGPVLYNLYKRTLLSSLHGRFPSTLPLRSRNDAPLPPTSTPSQTCHPSGSWRCHWRCL
ncbi:hypothetical protein E2C01_031444 [Portunus trituberculatus]|uniref:Uncharacterized protein n=1 Tax=Portunus trituberculatus TaxID=210409 RepID=A0A5B7EY43_PORTR|nr:hypothetical protein [Portunus trituberculatus]